MSIYINISDAIEQGEPDLVRAAKACMAAVNRAQLADVSLKCVQLLKTESHVCLDLSISAKQSGYLQKKSKSKKRRRWIYLPNIALKARLKTYYFQTQMPKLNEESRNVLLGIINMGLV